MAKKSMFNNARFMFVGELGYGNEPMSVSRMGESEWFKDRLAVSIRNGQNSPYLSMEHIHKGQTESEVRLMTNEKDDEGKTKWITVKADETESEEIMKLIPDFMKVTIDLETDFDKKKEYTSLIFKKRNHEIENNKLLKQEELSDAEKYKIEDNKNKIEEYSNQIKELAVNRKEFIMKDAIKFLNSALPVLKGLKVKVTGQPTINYYKGKASLQYVPSMIEIVPNDTDNCLKVWTDVFYSKDDVDDDKKEKKMIINTYMGQRKGGQDKLYPVPIIFDYTKYDENIEEHKMLLDYQKSTFETKNKKVYYRHNVELNVVEGAEIVEFDESKLTDKQKLQIKMGLSKLEDFKPRGNVYGDRIHELKFFKAILKDDFADGAIEAFNVKDLGDYLESDDSDIKKEDVKVEDESKEEKKETNTQDLMAKLFN